ncbi:MAG: hypothetical protein M0Z46_13575 [Actinomycetota bacterium]|nr:hypothetical protein [Actinomycetota bacterium]
MTAARQPPHRRGAPERDVPSAGTPCRSAATGRLTSAHGGLSSATGDRRPEGETPAHPGLAVVLPPAPPRLTPDAAAALLRLLLRAAEPARAPLEEERVTSDDAGTATRTRGGRTSGDRDDRPDETRRAA